MAFCELLEECIWPCVNFPWWAMRILGVDKYNDVRTRVRVGDGFSEELDVVVENVASQNPK